MFKRGLVTAADNTTRTALVEFQDVDMAWWIPMAAGVPDLSVDDVVYVAFLGLEMVDAVIMDREGPREESELVLGETDSTAYRGDRGKAAYDHSQATGNPHGTSKADVGLGNVNNTADADKPVSTAAASALAGKADLVSGKVPSTQLPGLLALGESDSTAYRGDRGKAAYDVMHAAVTVSDTDTIDLTLAGQQIAAAIKSGSITMAMLVTAILSGNAATLATGIKGLSGNPAIWDANGNLVDGGVWQSYTPTLSGITKGDGVLSGSYCDYGTTFDFEFSFSLAANSAITGEIWIGIPFSASKTISIFAFIQDSGTAIFPAFARSNGNVIQVRAQNAAQTRVQYEACSATVPMTWAATDMIVVGGRCKK
jgi:hypothetical protein